MLLVAAVPLESRIACRNEPVPESFVVVTVNVAAETVRTDEIETKTRTRAFISSPLMEKSRPVMFFSVNYPLSRRKSFGFF
jgi:hypothetical protein